MGTPAVLECFGRSRGPQRSYRLVRPFQRIRCHPETPLRPCLCMYTPQHVFWLMWWFLESNNFINLQFFSKKPIWVLNRTLCYIHRLFETFKWTRVKFFLNKDCSYKFIVKKTLLFIKFVIQCYYAFPRMMYCILSLKSCFSSAFKQCLFCFVSVPRVNGHSKSERVNRDSAVGYDSASVMSSELESSSFIDSEEDEGASRSDITQCFISLKHIHVNLFGWECRIHFLSNNDSTNLPTDMNWQLELTSKLNSYWRSCLTKIEPL